MSDPLWLIYHLPKAGGTTIDRHIHRYLPDQSRYCHIGVRPASSHITPAEFAELSQAERDRLVIIHGHGVGRYLLDYFPGREVREVFLVREPAARIVSLYNFMFNRRPDMRTRGVTFTDFLRDMPVDSSLEWYCTRLGIPLSGLALDQVLYVMSHGIALTSESLDDTLPLLMQAIGLPDYEVDAENVTGRDHARVFDLTGHMRQMIRVLNPLDSVLHACAQSLVPDSRQRLIQFTLDRGR